jgi:hypothetical protein
MNKRRYLKDTKAFWKEREKSRAALDAKRSAASASQKMKTAEKLRTDAIFLKHGKIV